MEDNPFAALVRTIREDNDERLPAAFRVGTVQAESPISIDIGGALQERAALVFTSPEPYYERGSKLLLIPIEDEQRYIVLGRLYGL